MIRLAPLLAVLPFLASCGGGPTDAAPTPGSASPTEIASGAAPSPRAPFVPTHASVARAAWRLPYAAGRQAVVQVSPGQVLVAGGLVAGDRSTGRVLLVDLRGGDVSPEPSLAVPVHDTAGALAGTTPLVVGGGNATEQATIQALHGFRWRVVGRLPTTRSDLSAVSRGATALVLGGYDGSSTPTSVLAVSADGTSRPVGRLVRGVRYAATATVGHTAYVLGGEVSGQELDTVQAVDLRTGRTRVVGRLPVPLGHAMAARVGSRILVAGGRTSPDRQTAAMWWFDPATASFRRAGRLPTPLSDAAVASSGHRVWLLGGEQPAVTAGVLTISVG